MHKKLNRNQLDLMLQRMRENPELAKGLSKENKEAYKKLWKKLTIELNYAGPPQKHESEWKKAWSDQRRYLSKKKELFIFQEQRPKKLANEESTEQEPLSPVPRKRKEENFIFDEVVVEQRPKKSKVEPAQQEPFSPVPTEVPIDIFSNVIDDPISSMSEDGNRHEQNEYQNSSDFKLYLKGIHQSLELMCRQRQMEYTEMKRHNLHMEIMKQEKIEQEKTFKRRLLQLKEEKLKILRHTMARK